MKSHQSSRRSTAIISSLLVGLPLALASMSAQAQLTYFDKPPSAQQLRQALMGGAGATRANTAPAPKVVRPDGVKVRGILWDKPKAGVPSNAAQQPTIASQSAQQPLPAAGPAAGMPINFQLGSARPLPSSLGFVRSVAEVMQQDPSVQLVIEGHTDSSGSLSRNMVLSWDRAMGVFRVLVEQYGIDPERLQPIGKGPKEPMPGTAPSDGSNRRVQFRIAG
jgi:outer membrane protein OmpA-like peptidoglycan-associated protein